MNRLLINLHNQRIKTVLHKYNSLFSNTKLVVSTKGLRKMDLGMAEASFIIKMEAIMMVNGRRIKCMDGVNSTIKVVN